MTDELSENNSPELQTNEVDKLLKKAKGSGIIFGVLYTIPIVMSLFLRDNDESKYLPFFILYLYIMVCSVHISLNHRINSIVKILEKEKGKI